MHEAGTGIAVLQHIQQLETLFAAGAGQTLHGKGNVPDVLRRRMGAAHTLGKAALKVEGVLLAQHIAQDIGEPVKTVV